MVCRTFLYGLVHVGVTTFFVYVIPLFLVFIYQQDECLNIHNYGTTRTRETLK